ncbi:hypothetical protein BREVNS_0920 [Brevinematales bacterium NS]|nr:hypothetical protein [Brevinematales bacterium]QJR21670.1 hypothetical protein BREVNS_0920 [Brevinematales bacterium NS]
MEESLFFVQGKWILEGIKKKGKRLATDFGYYFVSAKPTAFSLDTHRVCTLAIPMFQQKGAFS